MQDSYQYIANSEEATAELAAKLAVLVSPGMVITLDGDLGAGKTRFAQGFAHGLGVQELVNSPTFTIIKEYDGERMPLYHMDVYRISLMEAEHMGLDEYFYGDGITLIEWSNLIAPLLPVDRLELMIEVDMQQEKRHITLIPHGQSFHAICGSLQESGVIK